MGDFTRVKVKIQHCYESNQVVKSQLMINLVRQLKVSWLVSKQLRQSQSGQVIKSYGKQLG